MKGKDKGFFLLVLVWSEIRNIGKSVRNIDPWVGPSSPTRALSQVIDELQQYFYIF